MQTKGEAVVRVINTLKLNNKDARPPKRTVLRTLESISKQLISQKLMDRTIPYDYNIYSSLSCFEFEEYDVVRCPIIEFRRCNILMRSIKPLPELVYSRLGSSIKNITSIDDEKKITLIDIVQYRRNKNRKYTLDNSVYVYIGKDNHLYIPDHSILSLNLDFITMATDELEELSGCDKKDGCKSGWDSPFICPDKLIETVFKDALQTLGATYANTIRDSNPNGIDRQSTE